MLLDVLLSFAFVFIFFFLFFDCFELLCWLYARSPHWYKNQFHTLTKSTFLFWATRQVWRRSQRSQVDVKFVPRLSAGNRHIACWVLSLFPSLHSFHLRDAEEVWEVEERRLEYVKRKKRRSNLEGLSVYTGVSLFWYKCRKTNMLNAPHYWSYWYSSRVWLIRLNCNKQWHLPSSWIREP